MRRKIMTYRTAAVFSLVISMTMYILFLIMFLFGRDAVMHDDHPHPEPDLDVYKLMFGFAANFTFAFLMYILNFRILKADIAPRKKTAVIIVSVFAATIILSYLFSVISMGVFEFVEDRTRLIFGTMMRDVFISIIVVFSSQIIYLSYRKQQMAVEYEMLMAENMKTRYESLKNQLDPHFLFNTLNTLNSIIKVDPERAQEYVQTLSTVFRYTLQSSEVIPLREELVFTKAYCSLMQIRYGDSLKFEFDVADMYNDYLIVPLSVQTLVENAIKHNVISNRQPLTVTIFTSNNDTLTVSNLLQLKKEAEAGEGIGLANLAERYRLKWKENIDVIRNDYLFSVVLPLIKPETEER